MKTKILLLSLFVFSTFISCTTTKSTTAKSMDIYGSGVIQHPVVADLIVEDTKVTGTAISVNNKNMTITDIKNNAISNALKKSNADILIEPVYEIETTGGETRVMVTGFPGKYNGFRQASVEDAPLLELGILQKATVAETNQKTTKSKTGLIVGIFVGVLTVIAVLVL